MSTSCQFAVYYAGDAYSTTNKIMGRQSAGKHMGVRALLWFWKFDLVHVEKK